MRLRIVLVAWLVAVILAAAWAYQLSGSRGLVAIVAVGMVGTLGLAIRHR